MDSETFKQLLVQLQSVNNVVRAQAESTLDAIPATTRLSLLFYAMNDATLETESRVLAAVLCRRLLVNSYTEAFEALPAETQCVVKQQLLVSVASETFEIMRHKIADVAAELVRKQLDEHEVCQWQEFVPFLFECSRSQDPNLREIACHLFAAVPNVFGEQKVSHLPSIVMMLGQSISDQSHAQVRSSGMRALLAFVVPNASETPIIQALKELIPMVLHAVAAGAEADGDDDTLLKCLVDIADASHKFLRPYLSETLQLCYNLLCNNELSEPMRQLSLEVIVTLAENMPAGVRKAGGQMTEALIKTLLSLMTELEEDEEWETADSAEEDDDTSNTITAELALDRLACAMGGRYILNEIIRTVPLMLQDADWRKRHAGLMAVSACGEGCRKQMETMLASVLEAVVPRLTDLHPRVRYAACNAIAQMATDFGPRLQKSHHSTIVPGLVHLLDDASPRVQANAGAALVNFCENSPKSVLCEYLDGLVKKLEEVMTAKFQEMVEKGRKLVLVQIVTTIAAVADAAEERFAPYYDRFMPGLRYIMENAVHPDLRLLRGKTIECISLIGLAVGKEKFLQDAGPVMHLLLKSQTQSTSTAATDGDKGTGDAAEEEFASDDPQLSYVISGWARICKLLGSSFEPYLPMVMPQVLKTANLKPDICMLDNDEADTVESDIDWQVVKLSGDQNFAIRTSGLEDKATACQMLVCYARELKETFAPYCEQVLDIMLPMLNFYFNDEVRSASSEILPYLLDCLKTRRPDLVVSAWQKISAALLVAISNEPERELMADHMESLAGCIERLGAGCLSNEQLQELHSLLDRYFHEHFEKDQERIAKRQDEDYDELEEERLMSDKDEDEYVLSKMCEVLHAFFLTHKSEAIPFFQQLMVHIMKLLEPNRPWSDLLWGICLWDDVIEHGGEPAWNLKDFFLPTLVSTVIHQQPDVRQAAIYGIGVAAMHGARGFDSVLGDFVAPLLQVIEAADSRSDVNNNCTENAISALSKIIKYRSNCLPASVGGLDALLSRWITWLPVWEDDVETQHVYSLLCDLVEANNSVILGENNSNLPHIVLAIAQAAAEEGLTPTTGTDSSAVGHTPATATSQTNGVADKTIYQRCVCILRQIRENSTVFEACCSQLTEEQKSALATALESH